MAYAIPRSPWLAKSRLKDKLPACNMVVSKDLIMATPEINSTTKAIKVMTKITPLSFRRKCGMRDCDGAD